MKACASLIFLLHFKLTLGLEQFRTTYKYDAEDKELNGFEPDGNSSGLPVYIWIMGTGDTYGSKVDEEWLKAMADRGFIAGAVDYPNSVAELLSFVFFGNYEELQESWKEKAKKIVPHAISKLCERPRADCSAGVAVSGHSQGGFITTFSLQFDTRITAIMPLGVGCLDDGSTNSLHEGLTDVVVSQYLPKEQRLYITGQADSIFSEDCLAMFSYVCKSSGNGCREPDGSGYMVVPQGPHNFYGTCDPAHMDTKMKCSYGRSSEPWGLKHAVDWLAKAASPTKATITDEQYDANVRCDEQAISVTKDDCSSDSMISASSNIAPAAYLGLALMMLVLYR